MTDPLADVILDDRYRLDRIIGSGGMGTVYAGYDLVLRRQVAVKVLPAGEVEPELKKRFDAEMTVASAIEHQNLVPVYDAGLDAGHLYIVMRLVNGPTLAELIAEGPLDIERALDIFYGVAAALQRMHDKNYVHRDVKPTNILIAEAGTDDEHPLLADLGIVRALDQPGITQGRPPGTPQYMAPECYLDWESGPQADQYALACVLFEMLTGQRAFDGGDLSEIRRKHTEEPRPRLEEHLPEAPQELCEALSRALSRQPGQRFPSINAFVAAVRHGEPDSERPIATGHAPERLLTPNAVSTRVFGVAPDRDEKASQLAMETLLTLWANGYQRPSGLPKSPKRRNGAVRSLVLGENILRGFTEHTVAGLTAEQIGQRLAHGQDFAGSDGLALAKQALRALVDDTTRQGSAGATLMLPIHENLLWYDARRSGAARPWAVRKVNMRGTGVTLGRLLLDPPDGASEAYTASAQEAVSGLRDALKAPTPFARLTEALQQAIPETIEDRGLERDEEEAWEAATRPELRELGERIARHVANVVSQPAIGPAEKLWQFRNILALDVAYHAIEQSWAVTGTPEAERFLLLSYAPEPRRTNPVRVHSEVSYQSLRQAIAEAMVTGMATVARELATKHSGVDWPAQFEARSKLDHVAEQLQTAHNAEQFKQLAGRAYEESRGAGYSRPVEAVRVLLESIGLLVGTGQYRFLRADAQLLASLIGAVTRTPMPATEFRTRLWREWRIIVGEGEIAETTLGEAIDGSLLARNAHYLEQLLIDSGLAVALSDQTCMVGPHYARVR